MNQTFRYILIIAGVAAGFFVVWYFFSLVAYILISAILALMGRPLVDLLGKLRLWKKQIPRWLRALLTLLAFWVVFIAFFTFISPLVSSELHNLSNIDAQSVVASLEEPLLKLEAQIDKYMANGHEQFTVQELLMNKLGSLFNVSLLTNLFSNVAETLGNIFIAIFSITFITFFFLRDKNLFADAILTIVPDKHIFAFSHAMAATRKLLVRYFIGILIQLSGIFTLVTAGLTIVGVGFSHSLLIGLLAALLNVIPYLGPFIGAALGIILGIVTNLHLDFYSELLPLTGYMAIVFAIAQLVDNFFFQPYIFSSSVNAHPLEIFLLIMIAGSIAGIPAMIIAIPTYTVFRVFAKEFLHKFKVVKKLTNKIE